MDVAEYDLHRFLEVADRTRHDLVGRQPRCRHLAQETPNDPLIVVLYGPIRIDQSADCVPVEDIRLLFNRRLLEGWVVPIRRANIKTLLEIVWGGGVATMKVQVYFIVYFIARRNGLRCRPPVVPQLFVAPAVNLIRYELTLECVEQ